MRIEELARRIEARCVVSGEPREVAQVYGGNTMSELIANASPDTLLVTALANTQLVRVAELMDVPGICLVAGSAPDPVLISAARAAGTAVIVCAGTFESTLSTLHSILGPSRAGQA